MSNMSPVQVLVDDTDPRIVYTGSWTKSGSLYEHNFTTTQISHTSGSFSFRFNGTSIVVYATIPDTSASGAQAPKITCWIDDLPAQFVNTGRQEQLTYNYAQCGSVSMANDKEHTLVVGVDSSSVAWFLDYLIYNAVVSEDRLVGPNNNPVQIIVDDTDSRFQYSDREWTRGGTVKEREYGGSVHYTNTTGAWTKFTFYGSAVQIYGTIPDWDFSGVTSSYSLMDEGSAIQTYVNPRKDNDLNQIVCQTRFVIFDSLEEAEHTLVITVPSGGRNQYTQDFAVYSIKPLSLLRLQNPTLGEAPNPPTDVEPSVQPSHPMTMESPGHSPGQPTDASEEPTESRTPPDDSTTDPEATLDSTPQGSTTTPKTNAFPSAWGINPSSPSTPASTHQSTSGPNHSGTPMVTTTRSATPNTYFGATNEAPYSSGKSHPSGIGVFTTQRPGTPNSKPPPNDQPPQADAVSASEDSLSPGTQNSPAGTARASGLVQPLGTPATGSGADTTRSPLESSESFPSDGDNTSTTTEKSPPITIIAPIVAVLVSIVLALILITLHKRRKRNKKLRRARAMAAQNSSGFLESGDLPPLTYAAYPLHRDGGRARRDDAGTESAQLLDNDEMAGVNGNHQAHLTQNQAAQAALSPLHRTPVNSSTDRLAQVLRAIEAFGRGADIAGDRRPGGSYAHLNTDIGTSPPS